MSRKHGAMSFQRKNRILEKMYHRDGYPVKFASVMYEPEFSFRDLLALPFWVLAGTALWINERLGGRWTRENVYVLESKSTKTSAR